MIHSRFFRDLVVVASLGVVYFVTAKLGLMMAFVHPSATAVWPPTGIALAAFLLLGYRVWPGILLGAFLVNITTAGTAVTSIGIAMGNTLEGLLGAYLVNRFANGCNAFNRAQDIFKFAVLVGMACTTSGTFGVTSLSLGGFARWANYGPVWLTWWLGDTVDALVVAPLLVLWGTNPRVQWNRDQIFEAGILLLGLIIVGQTVFSEIFSSEIKHYPLEFMCIPFLIWTAFRFGQRESATAIFLLSGLAILGTLQGYGPFVREAQNESFLLLQAFMGVISITIMALAAVVSERKRVEKALMRAQHELEQRVQQRTEALSSTNEALRAEISERKRAEEALRDSRERFTAFMDNNPAVAWMKDERWNYVYISKPFEHFFKTTLERMKDKNDFELWPEATAKELRANDILVLSSGKPLETFETVPDPDGYPHDWLVLKFPFKDSFGRRFVGGMAVDITARKRAEEALAEQAIRDTLTGLYNRRYFNHRIQEEITRADRNQHTIALLLCDLDHFKTINDSRGHQAGDKVLKEVAKSIQESTRGTDLVFRWGGDEIAVILSEVTREGVLTASERIRKGVHKISEAARLDLDLSIGVALYPEHGRSVDELIRLADRALYIAKKGGDKIHIGEEEYRLDEHSIKAVFQPVMDLESNQILGYEALSRDPQGKLSVPQLFKKYSVIGQLNELKQLCLKLQIKVAQEVRLQRLFINVDFDVISRLEPISKPPGMEVILEISELEALHDVENHLKVATKWRGKGYKFAIDDFGAGFISLPFIASLVPEYIKVDRSTMLHAVSSGKFRGFLKPLLQSLRTYATEGIIAEGVETEKELKVMKDMGIHLVQGFLFGKPQELK